MLLHMKSRPRAAQQTQISQLRIFADNCQKNFLVSSLISAPAAAIHLTQLKLHDQEILLILLSIVIIANTKTFLKTVITLITTLKTPHISQQSKLNAKAQHRRQETFTL